MKRKRNVLIGFAIIAGILWLCTGFFIIQPIGAIPDGATVWFLRLNTNFPFVSSADGLLIEAGKGVSLLGRGVFLAKMGELLKDKKIISLPYLHFLYLFSTGGREFEK